jgi:hypothetical protein
VTFDRVASDNAGVAGHEGVGNAVFAAGFGGALDFLNLEIETIGAHMFHPFAAAATGGRLEDVHVRTGCAETNRGSQGGEECGLKKGLSRHVTMLAELPKELYGQRIWFAVEVFFQGVREDLLVRAYGMEEGHGGAKLHGVYAAEDCFDRTTFHRGQELCAFEKTGAQGGVIQEAFGFCTGSDTVVSRGGTAAETF